MYVHFLPGYLHLFRLVLHSWSSWVWLHLHLALQVNGSKSLLFWCQNSPISSTLPGMNWKALHGQTVVWHGSRVVLPACKKDYNFNKSHISSSYPWLWGNVILKLYDGGTTFIAARFLAFISLLLYAAGLNTGILSSISLGSNFPVVLLYFRTSLSAQYILKYWFCTACGQYTRISTKISPSFVYLSVTILIPCSTQHFVLSNGGMPMCRYSELLKCLLLNPIMILALSFPSCTCGTS